MVARADGLLKNSSLSFNRLSQNVSVTAFNMHGYGCMYKLYEYHF